jgi:ASC-1-like (ASCH) protein
MHIKDIYLSLIKNNIKKNEYRLLKDDRKNIKKGDIIKLISDNNEKDYIYVKVLNIKTYNNLYDSLINNFKTDFKGIYQTIDEAILDISSFYKEEDIKKYGIGVFSIKPLDLKKQKSLV